MRRSIPALAILLGSLGFLHSPQPAWSQTDPASLSGLVLDETEATFVGDWQSSTHTKPYLGTAYRHDQKTGKGEKSAEFSFLVEQAGDYTLLVAYTPGTGRDQAVPITIESPTGTTTVKLDQSKPPEFGSGFHPVGRYAFTSDASVRVRIETKGTTGHVIVDGLRLLNDDLLKIAREKETKPSKQNQKTVVKKEAKKAPPKLVAPTFTRRLIAKTPETITSAQIDALFKEETDQAGNVPLVDDLQFLRRVSLDLVGRQPTLEEYHRYLKASESERRSLAVERLLDSDDFGKNWGNFWSDVIGSRQPEPELTFLDYQTFRNWLAGQFNAGVGWDEIVFKMITAVGKVGENPQGAFVGFHQGEPNKLAGETTRVFLGVKIACAQCHDHPFIEMPQETFHGFAAFFVRTKVKLPWNDSDQIEITSSEKGEHHMPDSKEMMQPAIFSKNPVELGQSDLVRREQLAHWLVSGENPYFARAFVNHVWARLMGRGFYDPVDEMGEGNVGKLTELHNALAGHFIASNFETRSVFRAIVNSRVYQQADRPESDSSLKFTGATPKKLRGDEVFDSLATAIGLPNREGEPGPATTDTRFPIPPKSTRDLVNEAFGYDPSFQDALINRTMKQAMFLMNNDQIQGQIAADANEDTILAELLKAEPDNGTVIDVLYARTLSRRPTEAERTLIESHLKQVSDRGQAFEDLLWSLLNSAEFTTRN